MPILKGSNDHRRRPSSIIKIWWILLWRTQNSSYNSEAIWCQFSLKCLILVHFHSKIIIKLHFVSWGCLEAVSHRPDFTAKPRVYKLWPLSSIQLWGQWNNIGCKLMVIGHVNFHIEDYDLKFTCTLLCLDFECASAKFAISWLDCLEAFCDHLTLLKWAYSESSQNFE